MAGPRLEPGYCRGVLFAALLGTVALSGSLACRQVSPNVTPWEMTLSERASPDASPAQGGVAYRVAARERPVARAQSPPGTMPPGAMLPDVGPSERASPGGVSGEQVIDVRVVGAQQNPVAEIIRHIRTRAGRPFDPELIEDDVRRLYKTRKFVKVTPRYQPEPGGRIVIFEVLERPTLHYVKYVGNEKVRKKTLEKESQIKVGDALDPFAVGEGCRRLEEYYRSKGFAKVQVTILEGNDPSDVGAIYLINEGPKQRVGWTQFVGNTVANDARLRTKIQSKPGIFWIFKGELNRKQIDEDIERLTAYYRSLGYFRAKVSRMPVDPTKIWQLLTFVVNEGPRYVVRRVSFVGNAKFGTDELAEKLELKAGQSFHQAKMQSDEAAIREEYGAVGHIFADVNASVRFLLEEPGQLDLVYEIKEGKPYRVGRIDVEILGDNPHTRITTVLNRLSLHPGDLVDIRELRASERRLKASGLFEVDPMKGVVPQIVVRPPELEDMETGIARQPGGPAGYRGQSPDPTPHRAFRPPYTANPSPQEGVINLCVTGNWIHDPGPARPDPANGPNRGQPQLGSGSSTVIRGQYSADAGQWVPQLPQDQPAYDRQQPQPYGGYPPPDGYPTTSGIAPGSTYASPTYPQAGGSATYDQSAPAAGPQVGVPASPSPTYGNQLGPAPWLVPPGGDQPLGLLPQDGRAIGDGSLLLGNPPYEDPPLYVPLYPQVREAKTGRLMFSVGVNSDAGVLGSIILDEQNFDWRRFPRSWEEIRNGTAWRGDGQRFRMEAVPGTEVQKYTATFQEPYLLDMPVSLGLSGYFYNRWYHEWSEERVGGRVALGYQFTNDLSGTVAFRGAKIQIYDPISPTPGELDDVVGDNTLLGFRGQLTHDTRDNPFLATEGHLFEIGVEQVTGSFDYTRGDVDFRKYFLLRQHPDGSGRHVLSLSARAAVTSDDTPIYEHYYAGGFSTIRGFDFRGASPRDSNGVIVGGHFMMLGSVEYMFPITADENLRAVVFCDTGTVEPTIDNWTDNYRVAPGIGLRVMIPAMGPAPIALDFAFPVREEPGDETEVFSFFLGFLR